MTDKSDKSDEYWKQFYREKRVLRFYRSRWNTLELMKGGSRRFAAKCIELLDFERNTGRLLDVGCGGGLLVTDIYDQTNGDVEVVGLDRSPEMIESAIRSAPSNIVFVNGDAEKMMFDDEKFDAITIVAVLHELDEISRNKLLGNCADALKPRGKLLVVEHSIGGRGAIGLAQRLVFRLISKPPERVTIKNLEERGLANEIRSAGFSIDQEGSIGSGFFGYVLSARNA